MARVVQAAGVVAILLLLAPAVRAQQPPAKTAPETSQPQAQTTQPSAESMGISLKNIRKQLPPPSATERQSGTGLRYDFFVDVYGKRPAIDFFKVFDLSTKGSVRYGSVTHQEI